MLIEFVNICLTDIWKLPNATFGSHFFCPSQPGREVCRGREGKFVAARMEGLVRSGGAAYSKGAWVEADGRRQAADGRREAEGGRWKQKAGEGWRLTAGGCERIVVHKGRFCWYFLHLYRIKSIFVCPFSTIC